MAPHRTRRRIPEATVARLPVYLQILIEQGEHGVGNISSEGLAELAGVNAAKVRKDLSYLGSYGTRGVGYEVDYLVYQMRRELGLDHDWPVVIVGAGNLGQALAGYGGFGERGFPIAGVVDIDEAKFDTVVGGVRVRPLDDLPQIVQVPEPVDRCDRHPAERRPGRRRPAGERRRHEHLELRPGRAGGPARRDGAQGRSGGRVADPQLPRTAAGITRCTSSTAFPRMSDAARARRVGDACRSSSSE